MLCGGFQLVDNFATLTPLNYEGTASI